MENHTQTKAAMPPQLEPEVDLSSYDPYYREEFKKMIDSKESYKGKWNWFAFLFSTIWCFAKGAWVYGIVVFVSILLTYGSKFNLIVGLAWAIILGLRGNWLLYNVKIKKKQFPKSLF